VRLSPGPIEAGGRGEIRHFVRGLERCEPVGKAGAEIGQDGVITRLDLDKLSGCGAEPFRANHLQDGGIVGLKRVDAALDRSVPIDGDGAECPVVGLEVGPQGVETAFERQ